MRSRDETNQRARHSHGSSPDRAVRRRRNAVERHVDALVLHGIGWLTRFGVGVALAVTVVIENERAPALRFLLIVRLVPDLRIEPALNAGRPERGPEHIIVIEIDVAPGVTGGDGRKLFGF